MFDNDTTFVCASCSVERNIELKSAEKGRKKSRCKICLSLKNRRKLNKLITIQEAEKEYLQYFRLNKFNLFICRVCNIEMNQLENHNKRGLCYPCYLYEKRTARSVKAKKQGRNFISRADHQSHVIEWKLSFILNGHVELYQKSKNHNEHVLAWVRENKIPISYNDKFKNYTDLEVAEYFKSIGKPWNNYRLSEAERYRLRYKMDIKFRLKQITKSRISKKINKRDTDSKIRAAITNDNPSNKTFSDLGYTAEELKNKIQEMFSEDMSWDAFKSGDIHIDHILPIGLFDIDNDQEFRMCWGLNNLQPLWASDNKEKSDKLPDGRSIRSLSKSDRVRARAKYLSL